MIFFFNWYCCRCMSLPWRYMWCDNTLVFDDQSCCLTHWCQVTHIYVRKFTIIGSDNGLSPGQRQTIIWTNVGVVLMEPLGTNFTEIRIEICTFSFKKMYLKMSSGKWRSFCLGLNVLCDCLFGCTANRHCFGLTDPLGKRLIGIKGYKSLQWRHNGCDSVSNRQPHACLFNRLFRRISKN